MRGFYLLILVVGGAESIGNHIVNLLAQTEQVIVYGNLPAKHREAVDERVILIEGDIADEQRITQIKTLFPINTVVHVETAATTIGESVKYL